MASLVSVVMPHGVQCPGADQGQDTQAQVQHQSGDKPLVMTVFLCGCHVLLIAKDQASGMPGGAILSWQFGGLLAF
jgi:hypothetical protein